MAPPTRTLPSEWIEAGLRALASGGPEAVRIEPLAEMLGVTRGGFYGHFKSRAAFLDALLDTRERRTIEEVLERVEREGGDARAKVRRAGILTFAKDLLPVDLAVRGWARRDKAVATRLRRVDNRRMEYLRSQIATFCCDPAEVEARAMLAFALAIGNHFINAVHSGRTRAEVLDRGLGYILR
jgi:AcrR family transcriptional regulator